MLNTKHMSKHIKGYFAVYIKYNVKMKLLSDYDCDCDYDCYGQKKFTRYHGMRYMKYFDDILAKQKKTLKNY